MLLHTQNPWVMEQTLLEGRLQKFGKRTADSHPILQFFAYKCPTGAESRALLSPIKNTHYFASFVPHAISSRISRNGAAYSASAVSSECSENSVKVRKWVENNESEKKYEITELI